MTAPMSDDALARARRASKHSAVGRQLLAEVDRLRAEVERLRREVRASDDYADEEHRQGAAGWDR